MGCTAATINSCQRKLFLGRVEQENYVGRIRWQRIEPFADCENAGRKEHPFREWLPCVTRLHDFLLFGCKVGVAADGPASLDNARNRGKNRRYSEFFLAAFERVGSDRIDARLVG
jgi:hypothetical protein